jgi:hypothetical protein
MDVSRGNQGSRFTLQVGAREFGWACSGGFPVTLLTWAAWLLGCWAAGLLGSFSTSKFSTLHARWSATLHTSWPPRVQHALFPYLLKEEWLSLLENIAMLYCRPNLLAPWNPSVSKRLNPWNALHIRCLDWARPGMALVALTEKQWRDGLSNKACRFQCGRNVIVDKCWLRWGCHNSMPEDLGCFHHQEHL